MRTDDFVCIQFRLKTQSTQTHARTDAEGGIFRNVPWQRAPLDEVAGGPLAPQHLAALEQGVTSTRPRGATLWRWKCQPLQQEGEDPPGKAATFD